MMTLEKENLKFFHYKKNNLELEISANSLLQKKKKIHRPIHISPHLADVSAAREAKLPDAGMVCHGLPTPAAWGGGRQNK